MTGIECLRVEMEKRGLNKAQQNSKVVAVVLDILSETGTEYTSVWDAEQTLNDLKRKIENAKYQLHELRTELQGVNESVNYRRKFEQAALDSAQKKIEQQRDELQSYVDGFFECLNSCETPTGRDNIKKAQMFVNSVTPETKYDNTAYIIGLAAILSNGECGAIDELRKINPKIPDVSYSVSVDRKGNIRL